MLAAPTSRNLALPTTRTFGRPQTFAFLLKCRFRFLCWRQKFCNDCAQNANREQHGKPLVSKTEKLFQSSSFELEILPVYLNLS